MNDKHILTALSTATKDERLNTWHLAIYNALIHLFLSGRSKNPFSISRKKVMKLARIKAAPTYHKYMEDLRKMGYILYSPSYHPKKGSSITILDIVSTIRNECAHFR